MITKSIIQFNKLYNDNFIVYKYTYKKRKQKGKQNREAKNKI